MAKHFLTGLNLNKNELLNARIQNLAIAPSSPVAGQIYYNTAESALKYYDGAAWQSLAVGGSVSDAIDAAIAALDLANTYDAKGAASAAQSAAEGYADSLGSNYDPAGSAQGAYDNATIYADGAASSAQSAAETYADGVATTAKNDAKSYADSLASNYDAAGSASTAQSNAASYTDGEIVTALTTAQGYADQALADANAYTDNAVAGLAWKSAVNLKSDTNIDVASSVIGISIDGHPAFTTAMVGYGILLTGQTDATQNGIWETFAGDGVLYIHRRADSDTNDELIGSAVYVMEGTQYGSTSWVQSNHYITGFAGQNWTQFSGQGSVTAGSGITVDGLEVSVNRTTVDGWYDASGSAASAESAAKAYADGLAGNYDAAGSATSAANAALSDAIDYTDSAVSGALTTAQGYADTAEANAKSYADTLAAGYDASGAAANAIANAAGDGLNVSNGVLSVDAGTGLDISISGAVKIDRTTVDGWYDASGSAASAESNAATYTNSAVETQAGLTETAYKNYANTVGSNVTAAFELADQGLASDISNVASDLSSAVSTLGSDISNAIQTSKDYTNTVASGLSSDISNVVTDYQGAVSSLESSLTTAFQDADAVVLSTLRGEIQAAAQGLDIKNSVRVATSNAISLVNVSVVDGITLVEGNRVLVKAQGDPQDNGIYVLTDGDLVRAADADAPAELNAGTFVFVEEGTDADSGFVVSSDNPITIGADPILWVQFSGTGQIAAGAGLTKTGNTLDVVGTADRITANANSIDIASTYAGQSSIDTVGTITTGTWEADVIDVAHGGTGRTSYTAGDIIVANTDGTLSGISTVPGSYIDGDISGNADNVNGTVAIANGGTGATTAAGARSNLAATTKYAVNNTTLNPSSGTVTWTVAHNIGTLDVTVQIRDLSDNALVEADVVITNTNTVSITWVASSTVAADSYRVVVVG